MDKQVLYNDKRYMALCVAILFLPALVIIPMPTHAQLFDNRLLDLLAMYTMLVFSVYAYFELVRGLKSITFKVLYSFIGLPMCAILVFAFYAALGLRFGWL